MERICDYKIIFNRKNKLNNEGKGSLEYRIYNPDEQKNKHITVDYIFPREFDREKKTISTKHPKYLKKRKRLERIKNKYESYEEVIREELGYFYLEMFDNMDSTSSFAFFNEYMAHAISLSTAKDSTINYYLSTLKKLNEFDQNILIKDLTVGFLHKFDKFLHNQGLATNSRATRLKHIRKFIRLAMSEGLIDRNNYPFDGFKIKTEPVSKSCLTENEVSRIEEFDFTVVPHLISIIDLFLFGVYTGLRFSDIISLKKDHIVIDENGQWFVNRTQQKTCDQLILPLTQLFNGKAVQILKKYMNIPGEMIFGYRSNQDVNRQLKVIGTMTGIKKSITFHMARASFATTLFERGMAAESIRKLTGHKSHAQLLDYLKISTQSIQNQLNRIFQGNE